MKRAISHNPGQLSHRLRLEKPIQISDGAGGHMIEWTYVDDFWARLTPRRLKEDRVAAHLDGQVTHDVLVRHTNVIESGMRFIHQKSRIFRVLAASDFAEEGRYILCLCEEERR